MTYNDCEKHETRCGAQSLGQQTQGGYSQHIVVNHKFVVKMPDGMDMARATPLLCAGITVYSPMAGKIKPGDQVGIVGLGGLGHVAVRIAQAMGAEVTLISRGTTKWALAFKQFDVKNYIDSTSDDLQEGGQSLDFILDTVSGDHDYGNLVNLLKIGGELCLVGLPTEGINIIPAQLVQYKRKISGSLIGGIKETQEMLNFCAQHKIHADIELIPGSYINTAYERLSRSDVKYRFVINCETI